MDVSKSEPRKPDANLYNFAKLLMPVALLAALPVAGCARIRGTAMPISGACIAFAPITYSQSGDTVTTIAQIRGHNAAWDAICPGGE